MENEDNVSGNHDQHVTHYPNAGPVEMIDGVLNLGLHPDKFKTPEELETARIKVAKELGIEYPPRIEREHHSLRERECL